MRPIGVDRAADPLANGFPVVLRSPANSPRQTATFLFGVWLTVTAGCSGLPSRAARVDQAEVQAETIELPQGDMRRAIGAIPPEAATSGGGTAQWPSGPMLGSGPSGMVAPQPSSTSAAASAAEISTFVLELNQATHIDEATRNEILADALRAPPEQQSGLIRRYRGLLVSGHQPPAAPASAGASLAKSTTMPAAVPLPAVDSEPEQVVAASHQEPVDAPPDEDVSADEDTHAFERQLAAAVLREMKKTTGEAAAHASTTDQPESGASDRGTDSKPRSDSATWQELVDSAIEKLEEKTERRLDSKVCEEDEARLRMLYLVADRRDDAVRPIASLEPEMQEFWSKYFFGTSTILDSDAITDRSNRRIESKRSFDEAVRRLGESSPLFVRNLAFVTDVQSYGSYTPFDEYEFQPGEKVLLYAEVENYRCKETPRGYHTSMRNSFEIFDSSRQKVSEHEYRPYEEYCKNARRDFYTICEFWMPDKLSPGKYVLRLTVADLNGDKAGESSITFHIGDGN